MTQRAVVDALLRAGCSVVSLAAVGAGCPDLLVGVAGRTLLLECKSPGARASRRKDGNPAASDQAVTKTRQEEWAARWRGDPPRVVHTPLEALLACSLTGMADRAMGGAE